MKQPKSPNSEPGAHQQGEVLIVTDPTFAKLLTNPAEMYFLKLFLAQDCTVKEVAQELGLKPNTVLARLKRYVGAGLLRVVRQEKRGSRAVKVYRTSHDSYFIPNALTPPMEELALDFYTHWERRFAVALEQAVREADAGSGIRFYRDPESGGVDWQLARTPHENWDFNAPDSPAITGIITPNLYLDTAEAKQLQTELEALYERYSTLTGKKRYALRLHLVPLPDDQET